MGSLSMRGAQLAEGDGDMAMDAADVVLLPRKLFFRDGLREWGKAFAVGLPAGEEAGSPVVDAGCARVRLTPAPYELWFAAHE